jgi:F-type H+-transporting ATPase subunit delta
LSSQTVARRYAVALADAITGREEQLAVQHELASWAEIIESNPQLKQVLSDPTILYEPKRTVLQDLIGRTKVRPSTANFLNLLLKNQRLAQIGEINKRFASVVDERSGVVAVSVTTAQPMSDATKADVQRRLGAITGKDVRLTFATDEGIVGGMITRIGSTVYDGSIRNQLEQMEQRLVGN